MVFFFCLFFGGAYKTGHFCFFVSIDISECAFFALLIYQSVLSEKHFAAVSVFSGGCNISPCKIKMFTELLQILPIHAACTVFFYAKQRSIQVAQFFGSSLFISSMLSIPLEN